ncbi:hypothetical protein AB0X53_04185 [Ligilactobacillus salivarius]|uniref:hypothetical protein n=1 Tax=Ligilactobacillus salivarius TaxID=1624 RepID=UPI003F220337
MKINFKDEKTEDIYKVGNVIKDRDGCIYLIVEEKELGYTVVNLTNNEIYEDYDTMQDLINDFAKEGQTLVNAKLTIL